MLFEYAGEEGNNYYFPNILTRYHYFIAYFPRALQGSVPQSTLLETMTFINKLKLAYETGFVLGVNCFREIRFIINHTAERDLVKFTFMSLIVTVSSAQ